MKTFGNIFVAKKKPSGTLESQISFENLISVIFLFFPLQNENISMNFFMLLP